MINPLLKLSAKKTEHFPTLFSTLQSAQRLCTNLISDPNRARLGLVAVTGVVSLVF